jgi:hypothetical protein
MMLKSSTVTTTEELEDTTLQESSSAEENDDLEWRHQLPSDKADVHQFVGEQSWLNKTATRNVTTNLEPRDFFLLYFQTILAVTVQESNRYMQQDAQARNKPDITYSQQVSIKDLRVYAFLAVIVQMGHDHKTSMKLYCTKDELHCFFLLQCDATKSLSRDSEIYAFRGQ